MPPCNAIHARIACVRGIMPSIMPNIQAMVQAMIQDARDGRDRQPRQNYAIGG